MDEKTLYSNADNSRFFHIPGSADLPEGEFTLRSLRGRTMRVHEASVGIFEVPEAVAKEIAGAEMEAIARMAGRFMSGAGSFLRGIASQLPKPQVSRPDIDKQRGIVADTLGVTDEQLSNDPQAVIEGVKEIGRGIETLLRDAIAQGVTESEDIEARQQALVNFLKEHMGEDAAVTAETLPQKLRDFLTDPQLESGLRKAAEDLKAASQRLRESREKGTDS